MVKRRSRSSTVGQGTRAAQDLRRRLEQAVNLHQGGQTAHAELVYRDILKEAPDNAQALGLLGLVEASKGDKATAIELLERSVVRDPASAPNRFNLGLLLQDLGRHAEALAHLEAAASLRPDNAQALNACGLSLKALGRFEEALAKYEQALRLAPTYADALNNLGVVLRHQGRHAESISAFTRAAQVRPDSAQVHNNLGVTLHQAGRFGEAVASCGRAVELDPGFAEAAMNMGVSLYELKRFADSEMALRQAQRLQPGNADVSVNLGNVLRELGRPDEALALYLQVIERRPGEADVLMNAGNLLRDLHRYDEALDFYERAIALDSGSADIHWNRALCLLSMGDFERGWAEHEWRRRIPSLHDTRRVFRSTPWLGDAEVRGKTLHIVAEQGLGDTIQFCRYARVLKARGARVVLEVQRPLLGVLAQLEGVDRLITRGDEEDPEADFHCPLLSLPLACGTTMDTIPARVPYLRADGARVERWAEVIGRERGPCVGLAWSGNALHPDDHRRSMSLAQLLPALPPQVRFWSLQKEASADDLELIERSGRVACFEQNDFVHTAAQISLMDAVIAVDTSIAHLAAAMGKPVWLMLAHTCDWRWMWPRSDSPWYPSVTLLRQQRAGDWSPVLEGVARRAAALRSGT